MWNSYFKPPRAYPPPSPRSPSPPNSFVEPLSPLKLHTIEPNFNYPAINSLIGHGVQPRTGTASKAGRNSTTHSERRHHRTGSNIDTLADAALAISPSFNPAPLRKRSLAEHHVNGHTHTHPSYYPGSSSEPPHKRARSEAFPPQYLRGYETRPATSYESDAWPGFVQNPTAPHTYERRVEEAALLLNFSTTAGWGSSTATPPAPTPLHTASPRPHSNSFPRDAQQQRPNEGRRKDILLPPFTPQNYPLPPPALPSPQRTSEGNGTSPKSLNDRTGEDVVAADIKVEPSSAFAGRTFYPQQTQTPPEETVSSNGTATSKVNAEAPKKRGWPKGKPRGSTVKKATTDKPASKRSVTRKKQQPDQNKTKTKSPELQEEQVLKRRYSESRATTLRHPVQSAQQTVRSQSVPREVMLVLHEPSPVKNNRRSQKSSADPICAGCNRMRHSAAGLAEMDEWISCNGCKQWYHFDCAGFKKAHEIRDVDKYFCGTCEPTHGKTTFVRKSSRAHASVDYAELQRGVLKTSEESNEHHYIQPIKDGAFKFDPETFPRMRPELVTREFFERSSAFVEPICIPAEWNPRPWELKARVNTATSSHLSEVAADEDDEMQAEEFEYDSVLDEGQDKLDMIMPKRLTVRKVCNLVGPDTPIDVIDVKTQNSGAKWNLDKWASYYEDEADDKAIRNVISLEVSQTKLGRLLRRPKVVRDIDLQDEVWPREEIDKGKFPKVQYYCLMSIADSYTDFHIDFGGSSVYYHLLKGKKTFFFIPPKPKHLKAYEEWNDSPQQNFTFLPDITKECYRVDLKEGDTMLIPSGWIHAVWTPETSLVIGGNFLTRMSFKNQFKVVEIEKNNETPQKFRYPHFQRIMWYTAINYLKTDPLPAAVSELFFEGQQFEREKPIWEDFDDDAETDQRPGAKNARYYGQAEMDGLPELANFIFRTVMLIMGRVEGVSTDRMKRVNASIPKGFGEPLELAKTFALWVAWKRGNEDPPAWAHPDAILPNSKEEGAPKKLSARAIKELERKEAFAAFKIAPDRQSKRVQSKQAQLAAVTPAPAPVFTAAESDNATAHLDATWNFQREHAHAVTTTPKSSAPSTFMHISPPSHQENSFLPAYAQTPPAPPPATTMMIGAYPSHHISTPKTSILGPKRVACDTCRKRRIRCKHKDLVVQASPESPDQSHDGFHSFGLPDESESVSYAQPSQNGHPYAAFPDSSQSHSVNGVVYTSNGASTNGDSFEQSANGLAPMPGTNAYINANIPMAMNGVSIFGEGSKRGRSRACYECRKSKRRCIHDEHGNLDPVKAAETPIPRGTVSTKIRHEGEDPPIQSKKVKIEQAVRSPSQGIQGVLRPMNQQPKQPRQNKHTSSQEWTNGSPHTSPEYHPLMTGAVDGSGHNASAAIDPSLTSDYPEPNGHSTYGDAEHPYPATERPQLYSLPSLEQIATEVLDMEGTGGAEPSESGLAAIEEFNRRKDEVLHLIQSRENKSDVDVEAKDLQRDMVTTEGSVDSGVHLPAEVTSPTAQHPGSPNDSANTLADGVNGDAHVTDSDSATKSANSPEARRNSFANIPLYKPPSVAAKSPELTKAQPNGESATSPRSPGKRKHDSIYASLASPASKRLRGASGDVKSSLTDAAEDAKLAQMLQQEEIGLRRR